MATEGGEAPGTQKLELYNAITRARYKTLNWHDFWEFAQQNTLAREDTAQHSFSTPLLIVGSIT